MIQQKSQLRKIIPKGARWEDDTTWILWYTSIAISHEGKEPTTDEQFNRFVVVIQQVNINVPLMDAMQVPTYARNLKDIINNKRPLPTTEVVKLTMACSAAILHQLPKKKKDPGCTTIKCSIGTEIFDKALCDLGSSVSVMPKAVFDWLNYSVLAQTPMQLQLADVDSL